jgi:hypothetical protein
VRARIALRPGFVGEVEDWLRWSIRFCASLEASLYRLRIEALEHRAGSSSVLDSPSRESLSTVGVACHDEEHVREAVDGFKGVEVIMGEASGYHAPLRAAHY